MGDKTQVSKSSPKLPGETPSKLNSLNLFKFLKLFLIQVFGNLNKK